MAIYHMNIKICGRSKGQSAIAAAAFRSGEKLKENETGLTYYRGSNSEDNWIKCFIRDNQFIGVGDPTKLEKILLIFKNWIES